MIGRTEKSLPTDQIPFKDLDLFKDCRIQAQPKKNKMSEVDFFFLAHFVFLFRSDRTYIIANIYRLI